MSPHTPHILSLAAPVVTRQTERYEPFSSLIAHAFPDAHILQARALFPTRK